jgi:D-sedoheptulose 7-phosphate isomerase
MLEQRIQQQFFDSADLHYQSAESLARPIADAAQAVVGCITSGGKLLVGGIGSAAVLAQHLAALFIGRFERNRPALAAVALSADAADLARQVAALGQSGDLLLLIDVLSQEAGLGPAIEAAHAREMSSIVLAGRASPAWSARLGETDVLISTPHDRVARVLEMHLLVLHCLCDAVDLQLMGEQDPS